MAEGVKGLGFGCGREPVASYLAARGVDVTITQIEQSKLINNALFGAPEFDAFGWRNHAGLFVDGQYFWWHGSAALPDGSLARMQFAPYRIQQAGIRTTDVTLTPQDWQAAAAMADHY